MRLCAPRSAAQFCRAILGAARKTGMDRGVFPTICPWTFASIIDQNFWPDAA
jgi:hypothetical protein